MEKKELAVPTGDEEMTTYVAHPEMPDRSPWRCSTWTGWATASR
jgi:hypothetical protein